ncbi:MAG: alpha/beta hydrolase [Clostridia bacterium]|nr:alpha/beta hydrolase [Clostridia bacterium]
MEYYVWIIAAVIVLVISVFCAMCVTARVIYWNTLTRKKKEGWKNQGSDNPELREMYDVGTGYIKQFADKKIDLHTVNEGFNLYAEYYDLGFDRAVIIVPGRTEGMTYSYYYAKAYVESGYNVLVLDQRCHGKSDGKYSSFGFNESRDVLKWGRILHEEYGVNSIVLHGICIGCACSIFALTNDSCPDYFTAFVADGMYSTFYASFKKRMEGFHAPPFIVIDLVNMYAKHYTGYNMKVGPIDVIPKYSKPLLMLHGEADIYSVPPKAVELFEKAGTDKNQKRIVWFKDGRHSRLRLKDTELYDSAIKSFLAEIVAEHTADKK